MHIACAGGLRRRLKISVQRGMLGAKKEAGERMSDESIDIQRSRDAEVLRAAYGREGCPVCLVVLESLEHSMDVWEFEGFTNVEHRHQLIRSRGFCPLHTWQLAQRHNAFQLALVYNEVLTDVLQELDADDSQVSPNRGAPKRGSIWNRGWRKRNHQGETRPAFEDCPFCQSRDSVQERLISTLVQLLKHEEERTLLSRSTGLCLTHLTQARQFAEEHHPENVPHLLIIERTCLQRVVEELRELARKHDYRFSNEAQGDEMLSWRRGAELSAGNPGMW